MIKNRLSTNIGSLNKFNQMKDIVLRINNLLKAEALGKGKGETVHSVWIYDKDNLVEGSPFLNITLLLHPPAPSSCSLFSYGWVE